MFKPSPVVNDFNQFHGINAIQGNIMDEQELQSPENWDLITPLTDKKVFTLADEEKLEDIITENSCDVAHGMDKEYRHLTKNFEKYLINRGIISATDSITKVNLPAKATSWIISWIMDCCDEIKSDGSRQPFQEHHGTYSTTMKIRLAITYSLGRMGKRGNIPWQSLDGVTFWGNPSISMEVLTYMLVLKKCKYTEGEKSMSSRTITSEMLRELYTVKEKPCNKLPWPIQQMPHCERSLDDWGGPRARTQVHAITTLLFICLLHNIRVNPRQPKSITVNLTSRKTSPFGCKPFTLWRLDDDEAHICPVRAITAWIKSSGITSGYLFRPVDIMDRVSNSKDKHLTAASFLEMFRNSLIDIGHDLYAYGTHSLCHGACQWLLTEHHWSILDICHWGVGHWISAISPLSATSSVGTTGEVFPEKTFSILAAFPAFTAHAAGIIAHTTD